MPDTKIAGYESLDAATGIQGGVRFAWTYEELDKFLQNPRGYIPGTNMTFAGLTRDQQRADVIAYLRTLSENPQPLPTVAEGQQGGDKPENKPAEGKPAEPAKK